MSHEIVHAKYNSSSSKKTFSAYITGFILSLMLTIMAFLLVEKRILTDTYLYISLAALALAQFIVQSICFLNINASKEGRWNLVPYVFTLMIIAILVGGTFWIMYNLNSNMSS